MADEMCFLHTKVIQAIQETSTADTSNVIHGFLYGVTESEIYHVLSSVKMIAPLKSGSFVREFLLGRCELPVGVDPVGVFLCNCELSELSNIIPISTETKVPETLICLHYKEKLEVYKYNRVSKESFLINYQVTDDNPLRNRVTLNLKTDLSVKYEFSSKRAQKERNCTNALQELQNVFTLPSTLYRYVGSGVSAGPSQSFGATLNDNLKSVTKKILNHWNEELNKKDRFTEVPVIHLEQLTQLTKPFKNPEHAPIILYSKLESTIITVQISLDVIILTPETTKLSEMPTLIQRAVTRQLLLFNTKLNQSESTLLQLLILIQKHEQDMIDAHIQHESMMTVLLARSDMLLERKPPKVWNGGMDPGQLKPMHLWPEDLLHPITPLVSKSPEEVPESWRSAQHSKYMIPAGRPCFRRTNRFEFEPDIGGMLINPHVSAKALDGNFSPDMIHCVRGRYAYHHYMQDNFDDDKWGCAYRSLQTLISWFRLQGYTKVPVPKHRDIQQTLVDMGDKPSSFVGSKEWIGSMEVGFVLDKLLQVDSKILRVDSGAALASKGRELVHHFRTQGTPIMIGGGVLAHTILGVAYNEESGEIRFLILDPHYTGVDDLKTVVDKKWCGWKGETFWSTSDFYNMCMPQRPNTF